MVKKIVVIFLVCILFILNSCMTSQKMVLSKNEAKKSYLIVASVYPPFAYQTENGEFDGSDVEVIKKAAEKLNINVSFKLMNWSKAVEMVRSGYADGIFTFSKTNEREKYFYFPRASLSIDEIGIFANAKSTKKIDKISDLVGFKVGVINGYDYPEEFNKFTGCKKIEAEDEFQLFEWLIKGKVDYAISSISAGEFFLEHEKNNRFKNFKALVEQIKIMPILLQVDPLYLAFSMNSEDGSNLYKKFDKALLEMRNSGEIYRISKEYR